MDTTTLIIIVLLIFNAINLFLIIRNKKKSDILKRQIIKNISDIKLKNNNIESIMLKKMQGISDRSEETLSDKIDTSIRILSKRIGKREKKEDNNV
tara:strand:- start:10668 stop:10955 length:288 start_codon:yes stop_codon:yes gene_type:complete